MAMVVEWFTGKIRYLNEIASEKEIGEELQLIEIKLKSLTSLELDNVASNLDIDRLFVHLTSTSDKSIVQPICNIFSTLFKTLEPGVIYQRYPHQLKQHLSNPQAEVKTVILEELERTARVKVNQLLTDSDILLAVIAKIADDDLGVAKMAMKVLQSLGSHSNGLKALYSGVLLRSLAKLLAKNDAVSFRVYDVIIFISKSSDEGLEASANSGLLSSLIDILKSDDILLQLNALESISELASTDSGFKYLEERGILDAFSQKISQAEENPLSKVFIPGLMKFFGCVAKNYLEEVFKKYPIVISALFEIIEEADDPELLKHALDTLGFVASSVEGKYALDKLGESMSSAIKQIRKIIRDMVTELRLRALDNLALILHIDKSQQNNRVLLLTKSWFDVFDSDPMTVIVNICRLPFPDLRQSAMKVLLEISSQPWGQEYTVNHPGLLEFLLNRDADGTKDFKEIKYKIVKNLLASDNLGSTVKQQLDKFIQEGPFFIDINPEVAMESGAP